MLRRLLTAIVVLGIAAIAGRIGTPEVIRLRLNALDLVWQ
jgi:hypothetical protein